MKYPVITIGTLAIFAITITFQNCGTGFKPQSLKLSSSQCVSQKAQRILAVKTETSSQFCTDNSLYRCQKRVFSPHTSNKTHTARECYNEGPFDVCMDLTEYRFSTKELLSSEVAESFKEGGDYNRTEYDCYIYENDMSQSPLSRGLGASLDEAIDSLVKNCQNKEANL